MPAIETNFDAIPGPTHNYAGLSIGNLASQAHTNQPSNPRQAALQVLEKMKFLADLGLSQAVLPPHDRPDIAALRKLGFTGPTWDSSDAKVLAAASRHPHLLATCGSASAMWAANTATVSPSADTIDGKLHLTPANLITQFHRSLEPPAASAILKKIFPDESLFAHHDPLPASPRFSDEGAANHMRLAASHDQTGIEIFVYGRSTAASPSRFPARQTLEACQAISRLHHLDPNRTLFIQQNPKAIDAGAFHNDVVAVANENVLFYHEAAFVDLPKDRLKDFILIEVKESEVPLAEAVSSYLFNSQLVTLPDKSMALIAPMESKENPRTREFLANLLARNTPIRHVHYVDVRQSMQNGGGPACLRLRVLLTDRERTMVNPAVFLTPNLYESLKSWITRHYRDHLTPADLADPKLLQESRTALAELSQLLKLSS
jgi:succinylarginine dihydrolase